MLASRRTWTLTARRTAAQRIGVFTIDFPDPYKIDFDNNKFNTLNGSVAFDYRITNNIQTLSTKGVDSGSDPYGILYVPDLHTDACKESERNHVPANATRLANLPYGKSYALIAVTPWYDPQCMIEYFTAARKAPTKAIFVYQPGQSNARPPVLNDASWNLQDGGSWQSANNFPTYALSPMTGSVIMDQLGKYSGNVSDVPNGDVLSQTHNATDYIRLWSSVSTGEYGSQSIQILTDMDRLWSSTSKPMGFPRHRHGHPTRRRQRYLRRHAHHPA